MEPGFLDAFLSALLLTGGYNATLVTIGATLLGFAGGAAGTFVFLRKRSMVSDAISHATLPGIGLAFLAMVALGGDGRWLPGLLAGAALSAALGLAAVNLMVRRTRLSEDASIGAVLSVSFGIGIVLLTVIQTIGAGRQAGLETFLLGSTAGMLYSEAMTILVLAGLCFIVLFILRRQLILIAFDEEYAAAAGINVRWSETLAMLLALMVAVVGLKVVGLILVVALMIIPPSTARFWTEQPAKLFVLSVLFGGASAYVGTSLSAAANNLPTGPIVVLVAFALFAVSLVFSPVRGLFSSWLRYRRFQTEVHMRQGLLALARQEPIYERLTVRLLRRRGYMRADGVATLEGRAMAADTLRDEARWSAARTLEHGELIDAYYDGLRRIEDVLTPDEVAFIDTRLSPLKEVR